MAHARNHTATHIINDAARQVLGEHIWQAGAQKFADRARLDISHYKRIVPEEINEIEMIANQMVMENKRVISEWMDRSTAEKRYGFSLYQGGVPPGNRIRVLHVGSDIEACAGTHCTFTGQVGPIKILKTERIQDGVERIEYAAGEAAVVAFQARDKLLRSSAETLRVATEQLPSTIERFFTEWKEFKKENTRLKKELAESRVNHLIENAEHLKEIRLINSRVDGADADELTRMAGELASSDDIVALLISDHEGVKIAAAAGDSAVSKGINVGNIVHEIANLTGGGGGGKPSMARGGGKDSSKIEEGLALGHRMVEDQLQN